MNIQSPTLAAFLSCAAFVVFLLFALGAEVRTWSTRASQINVHRILCAVLAPMPFVSFASFNILYHSYQFSIASNLFFWCYNISALLVFAFGRPLLGYIAVILKVAFTD
jgi:hypothetical protein